MTTFSEALGLPVVAKATAVRIGEIKGFVIDEHEPNIRALHIGGTKRAPELIAWNAITAFGADAIVIGEDGEVHAPHDEREHRTAAGDTALLHKLALTELGDELGTVDDAEFDPETGSVNTFRIGDDEIPATRYLGIGSYALIISADEQPSE